MKIADLFVEVSAKGLGAVGRGLSGMRGHLAGANAGMEKIASIAKRAFVGVAGVIGLALHKAQQFEREMAFVSTMLGESDMFRMDGYSKAVKGIAREFGQSTATLSKGLYDILSSSIDPAKALDVLRASTKGAAAGFTETAVSVDAITTVLNAFGMDASESGAVMDKLFVTVKRGKLTYEQLASSIGKAAATASIAGISLEEMLAMVATFTRFGINADQAMTAVVGALSAFMKPSVDGAAAARLFGVELNTAFLRANGFLGVMQKLNGATADQLAAIFPNIRGFKGVAAAMKDLTGLTYDYNMMLNSSGMTEEAFAKRAETLEFQMGRLKAGFMGVVGALGKEMMPMFKQVASWLETLAAHWDRQGKAVVGMIAHILKVIAVLGAAVVAFKAVLSAAVVIAHPFGPLIAAMSIIIAQSVNWQGILEDIEGAARRLADSLKTVKELNAEILGGQDKKRAGEREKLGEYFTNRRTALGGKDAVERNEALSRASSFEKTFADAHGKEWLAKLQRAGGGHALTTDGTDAADFMSSFGQKQAQRAWAETEGQRREMRREAQASLEEIGAEEKRIAELMLPPKPPSVREIAEQTEQERKQAEAMRGVSAGLRSVGVRSPFAEIPEQIANKALEDKLKDLRDAPTQATAAALKEVEARMKRIRKIQEKLPGYQSEEVRLGILADAMKESLGKPTEHKLPPEPDIEALAKSAEAANDAWLSANKAMVAEITKLEIDSAVQGHEAKLRLLESERKARLAAAVDSGEDPDAIRRLFDLRKTLLERSRGDKERADEIAAKQSLLGKMSMFFGAEENAQMAAEDWKDEMRRQLGEEKYYQNYGLIDKTAQGMAEGKAAGGQWMGFADVYKSIQSAALKDPITKLTEEQLAEVKGLRADVREGLAAIKMRE